MEGYIRATEMAEKWGVHPSLVVRLCRENRIPGAQIIKHAWHLPENAEKPADQRKQRLRIPGKRLPLPVGVSGFIEASENYYYVDKTLLIRDFLDDRPKVSLFLRPRRFGKTLNMDMLRTFFEKTAEDTSKYFRNKAIWQCGKEYTSHQGQYPVIFLTFKDVKFDSWEDALDKIKALLQAEFSRHSILSAGKAADYEKAFFHRILEGTSSEVEVSSALLVLSKMLHDYYGKAPVIIIDEYDTPVEQGYVRGYYDKIIGFMRNFLSGGLKDNEHLSFGFLTGILRVAKEGVFSGLNNLRIYSVLEEGFGRYFGFTEPEIIDMCRVYGVPEKLSEIREWFDGYTIGSTDVYNPWSVISYFAASCEPQAFWQNTGSNENLGELLSRADEETLAKLEKLLQGETVITKIDTGVIYPEVEAKASSVLSFLLFAGYLKAVRRKTSLTGEVLYEVALPNREIRAVYSSEIISRLGGTLSDSLSVAFSDAILSGNGAKLRDLLRSFLLGSASYYDTAKENFYHGLLLGICTIFSGSYSIKSNRESGEGRFDLRMIPKTPGLPGILIEIKTDDNCAKDRLVSLSKDALNQIRDKNYNTEISLAGAKEIYCYGVAFSGKNVEVTVG